MQEQNFRKWRLGAAIVAALMAPAWQAMAEEPLKISYVVAVTTLEWTSEIKAGAEAAANDLGFPVDLKFSGPSNFDPSKQASIFMNEVQTSPDAIIITNVAAPLFIEPVLDAQSRGITVTWMNASPASEFYKGFFVSVDPTETGLVAAAILARALEKKHGKPAAEIEGKVLPGVCVPGLSVLENRIVGLRRGAAKLMPKIEMLDTIPTKPDREGNFAIWNQAIRKETGALAYVDACEAGTQNIAKIIEDDKLDAVTVAYDIPADLREAVKDGQMAEATAANFFTQGYMAVYTTATTLHEKKPLPEGWLKVKPLLLDQTNAAAYTEAWKDPVTGMRAFFDGEIERAKAAFAKGELSPIADYDNPPN
jgi:ribose transport system substrate-binding protein